MIQILLRHNLLPLPTTSRNSKTFSPKNQIPLNTLMALPHCLTNPSGHRIKKENKKRFRVLKSELPLLFATYQEAKPLYSSLLSLWSQPDGEPSKYDNTFVRFILGDGYVNMTNDNIAKGDPFGAYTVRERFTFNVYRHCWEQPVAMLFVLVAGIFSLVVLFLKFVSQMLIQLLNIIILLASGLDCSLF